MGKINCGISLEDARITDLDFADDIVIFSDMLEVLVHALDTLSMEFEPFKLNFSWIKTEILKLVALLDRNLDLPPPVTVQGELDIFLLLCTTWECY